MKINFCKPSFKGTYFLTSDNHSKPVSAISLLQKIENEANGKKCTYIDNGDFYTGLEPMMTDIYTTFSKRNKNIQTVFNLGNAEFNTIFKEPKNLIEQFKNLTNSGITIICSPFNHIAEKTNLDKKSFETIKPYTIIQDDINGNFEDIIVVGTADIRNENILDVEKQAEILFETIQKAKAETGAKKVILSSHNMLEDTKKIVDILNNKGINDIKLIIGGHSHKIEDEVYKNSRILHPAPQGKSAYKVISNENGYFIPKIEIDKINRYDYSLQSAQQNPNIIDNLFANTKNLPQEYYKIIENTDLLEKVTDCNFEVKNRENGYEVSMPSEMGTMLANKLKNETGADIGIVLSQDMRGELPKIGKPIHKFEIFDVVNADKKVWILNVNNEELFDIFNISLKSQHKHVSNSDFLEYSDNIIIERYPNIVDEEVTDKTETNGKIGKTQKNRIKEIYIKENKTWKKVSEMNDKTFKVATCSFIANSGRASLSYFKNIKNKKEHSPILMTRDLFLSALVEIQEGKEKVKKSKMINV